jgi:general secretion pathway protein J
VLPDRRCKTSSADGFTLLELLIAITLLALIVAIMMGAMRLAARSVEVGEKKTEAQERLRTAAYIMDAQIQSQLPLTMEGEAGNAYYFRGDNRALRLATPYSIWSGGRGYVIVDYHIETADGGGQTLFADEQTPGIEGKRTTRLFTDASEMSFEYYFQGPADEAGQWLKQWREETTIPERVRLHIRYGSQTLSFLFPVRARGETALTPMTPGASGLLKK